MTDHSGYFLYHSIGMYPAKQRDSAAAMAEFAQVWSAPDDRQWGYVLGKRQAFIDCWRDILGAPEGTVTTCESVTDGMHKFVRALPDGMLRGKRVLIAADCFPSMHFLLTGLAAKMGFTLDTVPLSEGRAWVETSDFLEKWDPDVGLALLTWISSTTSARVDLDALVAHGRDMGSLVGADITQGAGLLPFDVTRPAVDFALSTSLKWMCGTPGAGALYVRDSQNMTPEGRGWFSQDNPFSWDLETFDFAPDVRRFDGGTPGSMAALASLPALQWHGAQDHGALLVQNREMCARIIAKADEAGVSLASPRASEQRGGSVMLQLGEGVQNVVERLAAEGIAVDCRGPILRLSPGVMTDAGQIETAFELIAQVKL